MPILIKLDGKYSNSKVNENTIGYCIKSKFTKYYGGSAVFMNNIDLIAQQFKNVQDAYGVQKRPIEHFVLSFNDFSSKNFTIIYQEVNIIAGAISRYLGKRHQNIYSVHLGSENRDFSMEHLIYGPTIDPENLHVHFIINRVSYIDGKMFYGNNNDYWNILNYAKEITPIVLQSEGLKDLIWYGPINEETYFRLKI